MKLLFYSIISSLLFCQHSIAQEKANSDLINRIVNSSLNNPKLATKYSHQLLKIAKSQNNKKDEGIAYLYLADFSSLSLQIDSAYYFYDRAIQKAIETNDKNYELIYKINKAIFISNQNDFNGALDLFNECIELARKNNDKRRYDYLIIRKGEIFYEIERYQEALEIFIKGEQNKNFNSIIRQEILFYLSRTYLKLNSPALALRYIKEGLVISRNDKNYDYEISFTNQLANYHIYKKEYKKAERIFDQVLPLINEYGIDEYKRLTFIKRAKLLTLEKEYNKSIKILTEVLKSEDKKPLLTENKVEIDNILAENYKQIGDSKNASLYLEKYIEDSKKIGQKKIETIEYLNNININEIEEEKALLTSQKWILLSVLVGLSLFFGGYIYRRKRKEQQQFDLLIQKIEKYERDIENEKQIENIEHHHLNQSSFATIEQNHNQDLEEESKEAFTIKVTGNEVGDLQNDEVIEQDDSIETESSLGAENTTSFIIKDEKINEILEGLIKLEEKKYFLKQECTLHSVAKKLKTNTAYLSKIINNELGKSFSTYINELRINYIIVELKNNAKLRSYSVNAIAIEIGYKRPDAFSKYFKEATGLTPAIYIKKINQMNKTENNF